jgi:RNA polymerase sigma-70 factor (ECF subfamily)
MVEGDGGQTQGLSIEDVERLYRDQFRPVYNYLYFRLLNHATAEDLLADVFVRVVRARETFDPAKATPEAWLWRIARNRLFDHFRSMRKVDDIEQVSEARFAVTDNYDGLDDTAQQARQLLAVLSPEDRELVYLRYWQEMPNKQIAELLDLNASTVSTRLSRAMAKMRKAAEPQS